MGDSRHPELSAALKPGVIYYSPNELRGGIPALLPKAESYPLPTDYGWVAPELVLVEHKTVEDAAQSLRSGHLRKQLERAKEATPYLFLFMTGLPIPLVPNDSKSELGVWLPEGEHGVSGMWRYCDFMAALLAVLWGLQVGGPITGMSREGTAYNLVAFHQQTLREHLGAERPKLEKWRSLKRFDQTESYCRAFPGLGWGRAKALAEVCPTWAELVRVLKAGRPPLTKIVGIGPVIAGRIKSQVMEGRFES